MQGNRQKIYRFSINLTRIIINVAIFYNFTQLCMQKTGCIMLSDPLIVTFLTVVRTGSFTVAARELGVTQPAVSQQISRLEAQLGFPLFQRSPALELTKTGELFLGYARRIQDAYDLANNAFSSVFSK